MVVKSIVPSHSANDIEQEVYIKLWKKLDKYDQQNTWGLIKTITVNTCKDYFKGKHVKNAPVSNEMEILAFKDNRLTPDKAIVIKEDHQELLKTINNLPDKQKEALILSDIYEYSYEDIATKLDAPLGTIKSRIFNARKTIQNNIKIGDF